MSKKNKVNNANNQVETSPKSETNYHDFISLLFLICFLGIDFLPLFKSIEIIGPQFIYLSILNIIIGIYIYKNPSLISEKLILLCKNNFVLKPYSIFIILCGISIFSAQNTSLAIVNFSRLIIILFTLLNLIVLFYNRLYLIYKIAFIISIGVFIQSFSEVYSFFKLFKTNSLIAALQSLKGNTGSINILASTLSLKMPFILIGIFHYNNWKKWFLVFTLFLVASLIFLSGSRATYLSLFLVLLFFSIIFLKSNFKKKSSSLLSYSIIIIPLILSFFISNQLFKLSNDKGRYKSVTSRVQQATSIEKSTSNIRLLYWNNAIKMIQKQPLLGIGLGNWKTESIPYEKTISIERVISNNTHNDFLEVTTETGILNGLVFISIFFILGFINLKRILKSRKTELDSIALVSLLCLISYSVDSTFNFPMYRPTMQLGFCILFALTILNTPTNEEYKTSVFSSKYATLLIVISLLTTFLSFKIFKAYQLENSIRSNFVTKNFSLKAGEIISELPKYPTVFTSGEPFATYAGKYFIQEKNYELATKYLNIGHKINPYLGRTEYYKSIIAKDNGKLDSALVYSKKALEIRPRVKDYYIQAINDAIPINDSIAILEIHKMYTQYTNNPEIWINTSSALSQVKYENEKLVEFINKGLLLFPNNTLLIERKKLFDSNSKKLESDFYTSQAIKYFKYKNYSKALTELQKALKVDPNNPRIIKNIAICKSMIK
jgi:O-antigen ligase/tetratricopeptide (TPR) repeat protein